VWLRGNKPFVPVAGTAHLDLPREMRGLTSSNRGWVGFIDNPFSNPDSRSASMPAAFLLSERKTGPCSTDEPDGARKCEKLGSLQLRIDRIFNLGFVKLASPR
jgi:hypothetical protein